MGYSLANASMINALALCQGNHSKEIGLKWTNLLAYFTCIEKETSRGIDVSYEITGFTKGIYCEKGQTKL